ncbi:GmrSD restriction endonuclease domain-containing protein [Mesoplasma coleopterae]|uniref:GmrSD restriction endonuclease domain-containing protein n=1 Tax=Mesoplasma coleopterae TaxID=324078 RepID=UPI000D02ACEF|nr:DUF262 domain-containing protein [Mesoplasma coleopterae]AVN63000.1 hypothetical protein CG000_01630 [Mesoplasma coleopterae]
MPNKLLNNISYDQMTIDKYIKDQNSSIKGYLIQKDYQREYVWKEIHMKRELVESILFDRPIGAIITWDKYDIETVSRVQEVVDGQQRLKTILDFSNNKFAIDFKTIEMIKNEPIYKKRIELEIQSINETKVAKILKANEKTKLFFKDLPEFLQVQFMDYSINIIKISENLTEEDIRRYFSVLQNQEKLKAGEMIHALQYNPIEDIFSKDEILTFSKISNFNNDRLAFTKHMSVIFGMLTGKMNLGIADKEIMKKIANLNSDEIISNIECNKIISFFKRDILQSNTSEKKQKTKLSVLGFKVLLISYLFDNSERFQNQNLETKISIIKQITSDVGAWNSNNENKKSEVIDFLRAQGASEIVIGGLTNIWKISKTTHNYQSVKEKLSSIEETITFYTNFNNVY